MVHPISDQSNVAAAAAVGIVEQQPIAAAARQRLAADAQRRPDFALARQLPAQSADIFDVLVAMQLNGVEVQQRRDVGDHVQAAHRGTRRPAAFRTCEQFRPAARLRRP